MTYLVHKSKCVLTHITRRLQLQRPEVIASTDYRVATDPLELARHDDGWHDQDVAERQDEAFCTILQQMHAGQPRQDLIAVAEAMRSTQMEHPTILEVGCGSGYNSEVLAYLLSTTVRYTGVDYSQAMIHLAARKYPERPFFIGNATRLPCPDSAFDIVLNGVSLMHIPHYQAAIAENRRAARRWCIFHTVPVLQQRATTHLRKLAYGQPTDEVIFNEGELYHLFEQHHLRVHAVYASIPYDLSDVLGEYTTTKTYVCEVAEC
jgi:ubiquinone/menaquinone biosynthesis C-methylase UbiE